MYELIYAEDPLSKILDELSEQLQERIEDEVPIRPGDRDILEKIEIITIVDVYKEVSSGNILHIKLIAKIPE